MIYSNMRKLKFRKEEAEGRKLTFEVMVEETGLAKQTIQRLLDRKPIERIDGKTLAVLCKYFGCTVGDILEYTEEGEEVAA